MRHARFYLIALLVGWLWLFIPSAASADDVIIAVASNFRTSADDIAEELHKIGDHRIASVPVSTARLYAQIRHGAQFDAFLTADQERPLRLENGGLAVRGSRITYTRGVLALWRLPLDADVECENYLRERGVALSMRCPDHIFMRNIVDCV